MHLARKVPSAAALRSGRGSSGRCGCMDGVRARHVRDIGRGRAPSGRAGSELVLRDGRGDLSGLDDLAWRVALSQRAARLGRRTA